MLSLGYTRTLSLVGPSSVQLRAQVMVSQKRKLMDAQQTHSLALDRCLSQPSHRKKRYPNKSSTFTLADLSSNETNPLTRTNPPTWNPCRMSAEARPESPSPALLRWLPANFPQPVTPPSAQPSAGNSTLFTRRNSACAPIPNPTKTIGHVTEAAAKGVQKAALLSMGKIRSSEQTSPSVLGPITVDAGFTGVRLAPPLSGCACFGTSSFPSSRCSRRLDTHNTVSYVITRDQ